MNKDLNLNRILRSVDRKILVLIIIGVVATFSLQNFLINPTEIRIKAATTESATLEKETQDLEARVQEILSAGTQSIDDVTARVMALEKAVPTVVDDLALTAELFQLAGTDVVIDTVQESEVVPPASKTGLSYVLYDLTGSGSLGGIGQYLQVIALTGNHIITVDQLDVTVSKSRTNNRNPQGAVQAPDSVASAPVVTFTARLRVWYDAKDRLLDKPATPAPDPSGSAAPQTGGGAASASPGGTAQTPQVQPSGSPRPTGTPGAGVQQGSATTPATGQQPSGATTNGGQLEPGQQVLPGQPTN